MNSIKIKETKDTVGMLSIIAERNLNILLDEQVGACFIDWQKTFDRVNWTKLIQILKETGIDWRIIKKKEGFEC
jgi:hypothetical protein